MPTDYGNCGRGYVYNEHVPDLPRMEAPDVHDVVEKTEREYGFDWPGIGPPPRDLPSMAPAERYRRRYWADEDD